MMCICPCQILPLLPIFIGFHPIFNICSFKTLRNDNKYFEPIYSLAQLVMLLIVVKFDAYGEVDDKDDDNTDAESPEAYMQKKGQ